MPGILSAEEAATRGYPQLYEGGRKLFDIQRSEPWPRVGAGWGNWLLDLERRDVMRTSTDLFYSIDTSHVLRYNLATISPAKGKSKRVVTNIGDPDEAIQRVYTSPVHYLSELLQVRTGSSLPDCFLVIGTEWARAQSDDGDDIDDAIGDYGGDSHLENVGELPYTPSNIVGSRDLEFDRNTHSPPSPVVPSPAPVPGVDYRVAQFMHKIQGVKWEVWQLYFDNSQEWWFPSALPKEVKAGSTMVDGEFRELAAGILSCHAIGTTTRFGSDPKPEAHIFVSPILWSYNEKVHARVSQTLCSQIFKEILAGIEDAGMGKGKGREDEILKNRDHILSQYINLMKGVSILKSTINNSFISHVRLPYAAL